MSKASSEVSSTVLRALDVLEYLKNSIGPQSITQIAKNLDFSLTIVHRSLATLKSKGFVYQDKQSKLYSLGTVFMEYANKLTRELPFSSIIEPVLIDLRNKTEETVGFYVLNGYQRVCILEYESKQEIRRSVGVGTVHPAHLGATGRAIAAFSPQFIQADILRKINKEHLNDYKEKIEETQKKGYAVSFQEITQNVTAVSAPAFDNNNRLIGAISISGPMFRFQQAQINDYVPLLFESIEAIKKQFTY